MAVGNRLVALAGDSTRPSELTDTLAGRDATGVGLAIGLMLPLLLLPLLAVAEVGASPRLLPLLLPLSSFAACSSPCCWPSFLSSLSAAVVGLAPAPLNQLGTCELSCRWRLVWLTAVC